MNSGNTTIKNIDSDLKGDKEIIDLYNSLLISLEFIKGNFNILYKGISDNGIDFGIVTDLNGLPEKLGYLFFNVDLKFNVKVCESLKYETNYEKFYNVNIKLKQN